MSAPCPPWSAAGVQQGLNDPQGELLVAAVGHIRIHRPKVVCVEHVSGFVQHVHYPIFHLLMKWAGYNQVHQGVFELANVAPVRRARWLSVYVPADTLVPIKEYPWPMIPGSVTHFDIFFPLDEDTILQLQPTTQEASKYFDPQYAPGNSKTLTHSDMLRIRLPDLTRQLPTCMFQYGNAHRLDDKHLRKKGLFGYFVRQGASFRFFAPFELLLLHIQLDACVLAKPNTVGWQTIGNCISTPQAAFSLAHAFQVLQELTQSFDIHAFITALHQQRYRASQIDLLQDDMAYYVGMPLETQHLQGRLQFFVRQMQWNPEQPFRWPTGFMFSCTKGLVRLHPEPPTEVLSPTEDFRIQFPMQLFVIPGEYGTYQVDEAVTWGNLLSLWQFPLTPQFPLALTDMDKTITNVIASDRLMLQPTTDWSMTDIVDIPDRVMMCYRSSTDLFLYEIATTDTWQQISNNHALPVNCSDIWGIIKPTRTFDHHVEVTEIMEPVVPIPQFLDLLPSLRALKLHVWIPSSTDILAIDVEGTQADLTAFSSLWLPASQRNWYKQRGRQANLVVVNETAWRLLLRPVHGMVATPATLLRKQLFARLMLVGLHSLTTPGGIPVAFKYEIKLDPLPFAPNLSIQAIMRCIDHAFPLISPEEGMRLVSSGKVCTEASDLQDLKNRQQTATCLTIHLLHPLRGGGGPSDTKHLTSKQQYQRMVESGLANLFLHYGVSLPSVPAGVTSLIDTHGLQKLNHLLHAETNKHQVFRELCTRAQVDLPQDPEPHRAQGRHKKQQSRKAAKQALRIDVANYVLKEGFFLNDDDSAARILRTYTPGASGVYLMDTKAAQDWITSTTVLALDELGLYVIGPIAVPERFGSLNTHAPAVDSAGREVLLNGTLIQLGTKQLKTRVADGDPITTRPVQLAAITVWKNDWDAPVWDRILKSPVREIRELIRLEGNGDLVGKPWGRCYHDQGHNVAPEHATSIQFHCELDATDKLNTCLQRSGFNGIYITPKQSDGTLAQGYRVIWLEGNPKQLESKCIAVPGVAGLVRGKKSYGLRIEVASFSAAWNRLRPGQPIPDHTQTSRLYKLQPMPNGTDASIVVQWAAQHGWKVKAIKALGAKQWLVGADAPPPSVLCFNTQPILAQEVAQKGPVPQGAIAAGPKLTSQKAANPQEENPFKQGDPYFDPWARTRAATDLSAPSSEQVTDQGPVAAMFDSQNARIKEIEGAMAKMQESHTQAIQSLDTKCQGIQQSLTQHVQTTDTKLDYLHQESQQLHQTLAGALAKQDDRLAASLEEMKQLLVASRGMKRTTDDAAEAVLSMNE
eukprot:Skav208685  [mRNA]  locus=scaffold6485:1060:4992:+ [translate_table: standard]